MAYFSKIEIEKVKQLDLYNYLKNYNPEELVHFSRNTYITRSHDSLKISNGMWYWFSRSIGGKTALEYLIKVEGYSFIGAVEHLMECLKINPVVKYSYPVKEISKFKLPEKNYNNLVAINYLRNREIDNEIILYCISNELLYEEKNSHNVVFLGYDYFGKVRYAGIRGVRKERFLKDAYGSDKSYSFRIEAVENSKEVHLFESAIDLLSYATLEKMKGNVWNENNLISLAGIYRPSKISNQSKVPSALNYYLNNNKDINKIILHLDNDYAGQSAAKAIIEIMSDKYEVINKPPLIGKDYNDFLLYIISNNKKREKSGSEKTRI